MQNQQIINDLYEICRQLQLETHPQADALKEIILKLERQLQIDKDFERQNALQEFYCKQRDGLR